MPSLSLLSEGDLDPRWSLGVLPERLAFRLELLAARVARVA